MMLAMEGPLQMSSILSFAVETDRTHAPVSVWRGEMEPD